MKQGKATVARQPKYSKTFVAAVFKACDEAAPRITGQAIATEADVNATHVYNVRAHRRQSAPVIDAALRLLALRVGATVDALESVIRERLERSAA